MGSVDVPPGCADAIVPLPVRRATTWAALLALGTTAVLGLAAHLPSVIAADHRLDLWVVSSTERVRPLLRPVADLSGPAVMGSCAVALSGVCLWLRRFAAAALALGAPAATAVLSDVVLKPAVARPSLAGGFAYPSGHAAVAATLAAVVVVLALPGGTLAVRTSPAVRWLLRGTAAGVTTYVAVALVALDYHSTTDVVGGAALGAGTAGGLALLLDRAVDATR